MRVFARNVSVAESVPVNLLIPAFAGREKRCGMLSVAVTVNTIMGYAVSLGYVLLCVCICGMLKKKCGTFLSRKILHILMANWWHIRLIYIDSNLLWIGPLVFVILLAVYEQKKRIKPGMEYFCLSLTIMTLITELNRWFLIPATAAVFVMGYADAAAAIFGYTYQKFKRTDRPYSIVGSIAFFIVANIVLVISTELSINVFYLSIVSIVLTLIEAKVFPKYDNITVPVSTFVLMCFLYKV